MSDLSNKVEAYVLKRRELDALRFRLNQLTNKDKTGEVDKLGAFLVGYIESNPVASLESRNGYKLGKGTKRSADIVDYAALADWAEEEGDEYIKERWGLLQTNHKMKGIKEEVFTAQPNRRLLKVMLDHYASLAENTGRDMNDLLPPGLKQKATTYIIMRKPTQKAKMEELTGVGDTLLDMAIQGDQQKDE